MYEVGSDSPSAFCARTVSCTAWSGPLPGVWIAHTVVVQVVVEYVAPVAAIVAVTWKPVIGELLKAPGVQLRVRLRSAMVVICTFETGAGRSWTETTTVPHVYRSGSPVASATSYCSVVSAGAAFSETVMLSSALSALGVIDTPAGRAPPRPRTASTRSGLFGNGLVAWSLASTSTVVVCPRGAITRSGCGLASGRVDGTMLRSILPASPALTASLTPIWMDGVLPFFTPAPTPMVSLVPESDRSTPSGRGFWMLYCSSPWSLAYG